MPSCYYLTEGEAAALDAWVRGGGVLLCEAHLGGYNGTTGRHSRAVPGCGLAESWGLREEDSTSSYHLHLQDQPTWEAPLPPEVEQALAELRTGGARFFPVRLRDGAFAWGANRYAILDGADLTSEGSFDGVHPCLASKSVGSGQVVYSGTNLGEGAGRGGEGLLALLRDCCNRAGVAPTLGAEAEMPASVHLDVLCDAAGPRFLAITSRADRAQTVRVSGKGRWRGLFTGEVFTLSDSAGLKLPPRLADILVPEVASASRRWATGAHPQGDTR
jgi:hypothetical protein